MGRGVEDAIGGVEAPCTSLYKGIEVSQIWWSKGDRTILW